MTLTVSAVDRSTTWPRVRMGKFVSLLTCYCWQLGPAYHSWWSGPPGM